MLEQLLITEFSFARKSDITSLRWPRELGSKESEKKKLTPWQVKAFRICVSERRKQDLQKCMFILKYFKIWYTSLFIHKHYSGPYTKNPGMMVHQASFGLKASKAKCPMVREFLLPCEKLVSWELNLLKVFWSESCQSVHRSTYGPWANSQPCEPDNVP